MAAYVDETAQGHAPNAQLAGRALYAIPRVGDILVRLGVGVGPQSIIDLSHKFGKSLPKRATLSPLLNTKRAASYQSCRNVFDILNLEYDQRFGDKLNSDIEIVGCEYFVDGLSWYLDQGNIDRTAIIADCGFSLDWVNDLRKGKSIMKRAPYAVCERICMALNNQVPIFRQRYGANPAEAISSRVTGIQNINKISPITESLKSSTVLSAMPAFR